MLKDFIVRFFDQVEKENIKYCVLRNYESLPESVGHDIDMLMDGSLGHETVKGKVASIVAYLGWDYICTYDKDAFFTYVCYKAERSSVQTLQLDIWTDLRWRGIPWIDTQGILNTARKENGFFIPAKAAEAAVTGVKELMGNGRVPKKYYDKISAYCKEERDAFIELMQKPFSIDAARIAAHCEKREFDAVDAMGKQLKRRLIRARPATYLGASFSRLTDKLSGFVRPKGKLIAFIGPDGSGKTTIIDMQKDYLKSMFSYIKQYHIRFEILPELKTGHGFSSMKGQLSGSAETGRPASQKERRSLLSKLASWFVVMYYSMEFFIGRAAIKKHRMSRALILFDRYFYDFFAQPTTRELIWPFRKLLLLIAKKPDILIHLNADAQVVYGRKKELKVHEIETQNEYMRKIVKDVKNAYSVDTSTKPADEIGAEIFAIIMRELKKDGKE